MTSRAIRSASAIGRPPGREASRPGDRAAFDELEHDVGELALLAGVVDGEDVRMDAELRRDPHLAQQPGALVLAQVGGADDGDGDTALELVVVGDDDALAGPRAERVQRPVAAVVEALRKRPGAAVGRQRRRLLPARRRGHREPTR